MSLPYWYRGKTLLTVRELASLLQISERTIYNGISKSAKNRFPIPWRRIGRLVRFDVQDVSAYIEQSRQQ